MRTKKLYIINHYELLQMNVVEISIAVGCTVPYVRRVLRSRI